MSQIDHRKLRRSADYHRHCAKTARDAEDAQLAAVHRAAARQLDTLLETVIAEQQQLNALRHR